jgi:hypothetical protein
MMSVMDSKSRIMSDNLNKLQSHVDQMGNWTLPGMWIRSG